LFLLVSDPPQNLTSLSLQSHLFEFDLFSSNWSNSKNSRNMLFNRLRLHNYRKNEVTMVGDHCSFIYLKVEVKRTTRIEPGVYSHVTLDLDILSGNTDIGLCHQLPKPPKNSFLLQTNPPTSHKPPKSSSRSSTPPPNKTTNNKRIIDNYSKRWRKSMNHEVI
jgi:hypothetical protein